MSQLPYRAVRAPEVAVRGLADVEFSGNGPVIAFVTLLTLARPALRTLHPIARSKWIWLWGGVAILGGCRAPPRFESDPGATGLAWTAPSGVKTLRAETIERAGPGALRIQWESGPPEGLTLEVRARGCCGTGPTRTAPVTGRTTTVQGLEVPPGPVTLMARLMASEGPAWVPRGPVRRIEDTWMALSHIDRGEPPVAQARIPRWPGALPEVDGRLTEPQWDRVPALTLEQSLGGAAPEDRQTRLRLAWTEEALIVGFEATDPDVTEKYRRRDDPIYDHEAVELFLMPGVFGWLTGPYAELQASPTGIVFDASFTGPRRGMRVDYAGPQSVASSVDGSLDDPDPDRGWTSEWVVPWEGLAWVERPPRAGERWRANAFRIDRSRGRPDSYQAWSPPRVGDFHRVERFGWLRFEP